MMRFNGTLKKWFDHRGFGFVVTPEHSDEIFVHISAFPKDGVRPIIGELLSFEVETEQSGKKRAIQVMRAEKSQLKFSRKQTTSKGSNKSIKGTLVLVSVMILAYVTNKTDILQPSSSFVPPTKTTKNSNTAQQKFNCDGRQYCSQMNSRAEAEFFIKHCPDTQMDGDNDGIPCENDSRF